MSSTATILLYIHGSHQHLGGSGEQHRCHTPAYARLPPASGRPSGSAALAAPHVCIRTACPPALGRSGVQHCVTRPPPYGRTISIWEAPHNAAHASARLLATFGKQQAMGKGASAQLSSALLHTAMGAACNLQCAPWGQGQY